MLPIPPLLPPPRTLPHLETPLLGPPQLTLCLVFACQRALPPGNCISLCRSLVPPVGVVVVVLGCNLNTLNYRGIKMNLKGYNHLSVHLCADLAHP